MSPPPPDPAATTTTTTPCRRPKARTRPRPRTPTPPSEEDERARIMEGVNIGRPPRPRPAPILAPAARRVPSDLDFLLDQIQLILNRLQRPPFQLRQHLPLVLALLALPALPPLFLASLHLLLCVPDTSTVPAFTASTILDHLASAKTGLAEFFASPAPDATARTDHETDAAHCRARHVIAQHLVTDLHQLNDRHLAALTATNAGVDATACADARRTKALVLIGAEYRVAGSRALGKLLLVRDLATAAAPGRLQDVHWSREEGARECRNARVEGFLREFGGVTRRRGNLEELREVARALLEEERGGPVGEGRGRWGEVGW